MDEPESDDDDVVDNIPQAMEEHGDNARDGMDTPPAEAPARATPRSPSITSPTSPSSTKQDVQNEDDMMDSDSEKPSEVPSAAEPDAKRQRLETLNAVMGTSRARRILADIEASMEAKTKMRDGNHRQRRTLRRQEMKLSDARMHVASRRLTQTMASAGISPTLRSAPKPDARSPRTSPRC